jgi:Zn-dependent protease with chaperone function
MRSLRKNVPPLRFEDFLTNLRNFGLAMFLAAVGVNAGQPFVRTVAESGLTMLFIGVASLLTTALIVLWSAITFSRSLMMISWALRLVQREITTRPRWRRQNGPTSATPDLSVDDIGEGNRGADRRLARSRSGSAAWGGHALVLTRFVNAFAIFPMVCAGRDTAG